MQPKRKTQRKRDYDYSQLDYYSVPNHLHGIIIIRPVGTAPRGRPFPTIGQCPASKNGQHPTIGHFPAIENGQARGPVPMGLLSLPNVIKIFKTLTTKRHIDDIHNHGWRLFPGKLWQRSNNPIEWESDANHIIVKQIQNED